jgi:acyl-CoA reductase-like NAD-dependent aldehyde dehydrogenase
MATDVQMAARRIAAVNPATGEVLREFDRTSEAEVQRAVARARAVQPGWRAASVKTRLEVLSKFRRILTERKQSVAGIITSESGKPYVESLLTEVLVALDVSRFLVEQIPAFLRDEPVPHGSLAARSKAGRLVREPYGVIGIISPWNYPFSIPAGETLAALAVGNAVVLKPSDLTPLSALELESMLREAGLPADLLQVLPGDGATGAALVESGIDKLIFTGSVATGKRIAEAAASRLLPVVLELGGKDPMIVMDDADIDVASSGAVWGAFVNAGQACLSVERCYVHRDIHDAFVGACVRKTTQLRTGGGMAAETDIGPLINERQLRAVEKHVSNAVARGASVLTGGRRLPELGPTFYAPTVLANVNHEMLIMREETFGPVLPIMAFATETEAVRLANDTEFGLAASVWTGDPRRGERLARQIDAGTVMVNDVVSCYGITEAPHGGVKASGIGRTHGRFGLEELVRAKYVDSDLLPSIKKPWWYGYENRTARSAEGFLDFQFASGLLHRMRGALRSTGLVARKKL